MRPASHIWKVTVTCAPGLTAAIEKSLEENALAVTVLAPPRKAMAQVEALYRKKPGKRELSALHAKLAVLTALHKAKAPKASVKEIRNLDWLKKVAADFPPIEIGRWTIYGGAHEKAVKGRRLKLRIDASSAFGTGEHPTTRGCLLMLEKALKKGIQGSALDLGCGSGILAMAYAKATKGRAVAIDCDGMAVKIARENVRRNGLQKLVRVAKADGYNAPVARDNAPYALIMANIFAGPLCGMAKDLKKHLAPGGIAVLSGILNHQAKAVIAAHRAAGLVLAERMKIGEWSVLTLKRR